MKYSELQAVVDAMDKDQQNKVLLVVASVLEIVVQATNTAIDERLKEVGLLPEETPSGPLVYFLRSSAGGPIKIGFANDVAKRVRDLQRTSPFPLTVLATEAGGPQREKELHARFAEHRLHGEWFSESRELLDYLASRGLAEVEA